MRLRKWIPIPQGGARSSWTEIGGSSPPCKGSGTAWLKVTDSLLSARPGWGSQESQVIKRIYSLGNSSTPPPLPCLLFFFFGPATGYGGILVPVAGIVERTHTPCTES